MSDPIITVISAGEPGQNDEALNAADVVLHNRAGAKPPIIAIRTWPGEREKFEALANLLGPDQPIYSVAPPDFEALEDYPQNPADWVRFLEPRIRALNDLGDFILAGWSFGGVMALELAERLIETSQSVSGVILIDSRLPKHRPETKPGAKMPVRLRRFAQHLLEYSQIESRSDRVRYAAFRLDPFRGLRKKRARTERRALERQKHEDRRRAEEATKTERSKEKQRAAVVTRFTGERMSFLKRTIHVAYLKYERHETRVPLVLLRTQESFKKSGKDPSLGWAPFARGRFVMDAIEGEHDTLFEAQALPGLARQVSIALRDLSELATRPDLNPARGRLVRTEGEISSARSLDGNSRTADASRKEAPPAAERPPAG
ncbi:MAG: alpha/beta fold hydrolase [Myxococcota bacterium]